MADGSLRRCQSGEVERIGGEGRLWSRRRWQGDARPQMPAADHAAALEALAALPDGPLDRRPGRRSAIAWCMAARTWTAPVLVDARDPGADRGAVAAGAAAQSAGRRGAEGAGGSGFPACRRWRASTPRSIAAIPPWRTASPSPTRCISEGVRRYGFHGLSYEYIAGALAERAPEIALGRVVVAHLGSGASMCALAGGRSVDSSMGFTALDGLPMGTRSGSLDAGVILWLQQQKGWNVDRVEHFLYARLRPEGPVRRVQRHARAAGERRTAGASWRWSISSITWRAPRARWRPAWAGSTGMVFTAGIGEHSPEIRARVLQRLGWLGFSLDEAANQAGGPLLTRAELGAARLRDLRPTRSW